MVLVTLDRVIPALVWCVWEQKSLLANQAAVYICRIHRDEK